MLLLCVLMHLHVEITSFVNNGLDPTGSLPNILILDNACVFTNKQVFEL